MFCLLAPALALQGSTTLRLEDFDLTKMTTGWGTPQRAKSIDGHPLTVAKTIYAHGVGSHSPSEFTLRLGGKATRFRASVGLDDENAPRGSVRFMVFVDGKKRFDSGTMTSGQAARSVDVDLKHARILKLVVDDAGDGLDSDHADWADAVIETTQPKAITVASPPVEAMPKLASIDLVHTRLNGPRIVGCSPHRDFLFRIPASGKGPLSFQVTGLPSAVGIRGHGILYGKVDRPGTYHLKVSVHGPMGDDSRELTLVCGENKLALTPPMGWNSWNVWGTSVTANKVRAAGEAFLKLGLADAGFAYVNIDDGWEAGRNSSGEIQVNEKFGSMPALAGSLHNNGLKLGIYSSPGPKTCGGYEATWQHEDQDARTYAEWGVDYLKYDWCSYGEISKGDTQEELERPYRVMRASLDKSNRDVVFSLCQYGMGDVFKWGKSVGGNLWRTTGDITDSWSSLSSIGFDQPRRSPYAHPGGWNDPDMLIVGRVGWSGSTHPSKLTYNEQVTHMTMWSLLAAPLLIGCDLTQVDEFTKRLLMNHDVIDVDQDPLGQAATVLTKSGEQEVWSRKLSDDSYAVGLFNRGEDPAKVTVNWSALFKGKTGAHTVRNLWTGRDLGSKSKGYTVTVPRHGAVMLKIR